MLSTQFFVCMLGLLWLLTRVVLFVRLHSEVGAEVEALPHFFLDRLAAPSAFKPALPTPRSVHVVLTSNGNPYMNWVRSG